MRIISRVRCGIIIALFSASSYAAESTITESPVAIRSTDDFFASGKWEAGLTGGALFSPFIATGGRPTINYSITEVQVGYMLDDVGSSGWTRGNLELVGEGFGSGIFQGPGTYIAGVTMWARYNFVQPRWHLVPFVQGGMGLTSTDIPREIVGQPFNFNLEIGVGARYFFAPGWALQAEVRYQHISNANTGPHNLGINACGPILGVSYLF